MSHKTHRSIGQISFNQSKMSRILRRGSWKAVNLLVVLAMLLPNFTVFTDQALAEAKSAPEEIKSNDTRLSALKKNGLIHPLINQVIGKVDFVRVKPNSTDNLKMLPTLPALGGSLIYSGYLEDVTINTIDGHSFALQVEWFPGSTTNRNVAVQAIFDGVYDSQDFCYLDYWNQECTNYLNNTGAELELRVTAILVSPYAGNIYIYDLDLHSIPGRSSSSSCGTKSGGSDTRECGLATYKDAQGNVADPINTYTGGFDYSIVDLSLPTIAGDLVFQHTYSSLATEYYTTTMGYGWTHNHDTRLIFPDDPLGEEDTVWFKAHTTNQYKFLDNGDGTYDAYPGVLAELSEDGDDYQVTDPAQNVYLFDEYGFLTEWQTPEVFTYTYAYSATNGLLETVYGPTHSSQNPQYLAFDYTNDRLSSGLRPCRSRSFV